MKPSEFFELRPNACRSGKIFANQFQTMREVWENCERQDWLFWIIRNYAPIEKKQSVLLAIKFAESCLDKIPKEEQLPRLAVEAAKAWLENPCEETRIAAGLAGNYAKYFGASVYVNTIYSNTANAAAETAFTASSYLDRSYINFAYYSCYYSSKISSEENICEIIRSTIQNPFN